MTALLDTHFLRWIFARSRRLERFPWLERYLPWGVSPVSLLELQLLHEGGRIKLDQADLFDAIHRDPRFVVDEVSLVALIEQALGLSWTRDPFDRLLVAHSLARRLPLVTNDQLIQEHHALVARELV